MRKNSSSSTSDAVYIEGFDDETRTLALDSVVVQQGEAVDKAIYTALWDCLGVSTNAHSVVAVASNPDSKRFNEFL